MKTRPDVPVKQHIERLLAVLEPRVPNIREVELLFVDASDLTRIGNDWVISAGKIMRQPEFERFFERLVEQGYPWINLAGDAPWHGAFLVRVEHGLRAGSTETTVNLPGPSLDLDHNPLQQTRLRIEGDLEID